VVEDIKIDSEEKDQDSVEGVSQQPNFENKEKINLSNSEKNDTENKRPEEPIVEKRDNKPEPPKEKKIEEKDSSDDQNDDEELGIDFKELKNKAVGFLKNIKTKGKTDLKRFRDEEENTDEDISFDFKKVSSFTKRNSKWLIPLALILLVILLSTYFRVMPSYLPITEDWAENTVYNFYQQQIGNQVNQQYPNLPEQNRQSLIDTEWKKQLKDNKDQIDYDIEQLSNQYKASFQDENGQTYLLAIDPYLWYGETRSYINSGHFGTEVIKGKEINFLRNGREGKGMPRIVFHSLFGAYLYKIGSFFNKDLQLMAAFFYIPVIIIGLSIIPAFLIGRKFAGNIGGTFAAIIIAINSALLSRTPAGFSDTDPYNILFPLIITWLILETFEAKSTKKMLAYSTLSGLSIGFFSSAWLGWWYMFDFILAAIGIYVIYLLITGKKKGKKVSFGSIFTLRIKQIIASTAIFFFSSAIVVTLFVGFNDFMDFFNSALGVITIKDLGLTTLWPNVLTTVAEFNEIRFGEIVSQMGGNLLFIIAILGIIIAIAVKNEEGKRNIFYATLLTVWFIGTAYGFTKGVRFAILMVPAFALAFGTAVGFIYNRLSSWMEKEIKVNKIVAKLTIILILCLLFIAPLMSANGIAKNQIPSMNDAWYDSLTKIKENSNDAIITSWWDFGHWFVAIAERRVTFDGGDQGEKIHWVGKTLLNPDEEIAVGILRMLNCGQEEAVHVIEENFSGDTLRAINVLNQIMVLNDKKEAIKILKKEGLNNEQIAEIIQLTYCDDLIEQFYITSEDMVGKAGVWGHFGSWDFEKAAMYQSVTKNKEDGQNILIEEFNLDEETAARYYSEIINSPGDQWVATWPGYQSTGSCSFENKIYHCNVNLGQGTTIIDIDLDTINASISTSNGNVYPNSLVYATKEGIKKKEFSGQLLGASVVLLHEENKILLTHPLQADSLFTRLFFFNGHGLKCFTPFDERRTVTGDKISIWKVDFECKQKNQAYFLPE
jgi:dolichyl-phosphooligosaccharide-protein glycotransferase